MQALSLKDIVADLESALSEQDIPRAESLLWPALDQKPEVAILWHCAGAVFQLTGRHALAEHCWAKAQALEANPVLWSNRGIALKCMNKSDDARRCYMEGLRFLPNDPKLLANLCGSYVNEGDPFPGIEAGEKALLNGCGDEGRFNLALLHLEAGHFGRGFDLYAEGKHQHREERDYAQSEETEPPKLTPDLHEHLKGMGKRLIVYGEQGLGEELMISTLLPDVLRDYDVVFDCHPRLESLHQHSAWAKASRVHIVPTRKMRGDSATRPLGVTADAKIGGLDLCRIYRREQSDFRWHGPTIHAPPKEVREMRAHLEALAQGRRIVGLATRGGTLSTNAHYRTLPQTVLKRILDTPGVLFVGLDYDDMTALNVYAEEQYRELRYFWPASVNFAWDYEHVAALIGATDAVLTVCQSVAHLSAAMGHETHVLVPDKPAWRYGLTGERWFWYDTPAVQLHRQRAGWDAALDSALAALAPQPMRATA